MHPRTFRSLVLSLSLFSLLSSPSCHVAPRGASLYDGFGTYHRAVTTSSVEAQRWFDQGMQLLYGFNHDEAIRSFEATTLADPESPMGYWGMAYARGLHINNPQMTEEQSRLAYEAAREAAARVENGSPVEQALVRAVNERYALPIPEDRSPLDQAYAAAMEDAWRAFPDDPDVGALFAESLMNLQPWDLWEKDGRPKGRTEEIVGVLEAVLARHPDHPGANHFYIHTVEASNTPERAVAAAERLSDLVPGAGHLVHMPAHIFARVGRWADAADANERAVAADRAYFAKAPEPEFYSLYFIHNLHFLAYAAMMEGRYETAMRAARELERDVPESFMRGFPHVADGFMPVTWHVMIRFGKWDEILTTPAAPEFRRISRAMRHYARGVAFSALGRTTEARAEFVRFESEAALVPEDWSIGNNSAAEVLAVARHMLKGELAYRDGQHDEAFATLREGVRLEEALRYDEPPGWMQPVRHALGALLMGAGRADEAEVVYREDLAKNAQNGWSILGLSNALRAQGKTRDAVALETRLTQVWTRADVRPKSSCYCEPGA